MAAPPMHPAAREALYFFGRVGARALARFVDSALKDVDAAAKETSRRIAKARKRLQDIPEEDFDDDDDEPRRDSR
jgi:hypothetical protein